MYKYHHPGIPTKEIKEGETDIPEFKVHVSGCDTSPYKIEWMRFEENSPVEFLQIDKQRKDRIAES